MPVAVDLVHAVLAPVRARRRSAPPIESASAGGRVVGQAVRLDQAVRDVDAEAVDAAVEPEAQDAGELLAHLRVRQSKSGCDESKRCRYHWPGVPSASMTRVQAGPPKTDSQLFGGSSPCSPLPSRNR